MRAPIDLVITNDLEPFVRSRDPWVQTSVLLKVRGYTTEFLLEFRQLLPTNYELHILDAQALSQQLAMETVGTDIPVVSIDDVSITWAHHYFLITTVVQEDGSVTWEPKYSHEPIDNQLRKLSRLGDIAVVDIGAQSSALILECVRLLRRIRKIYLGVCGTRAVGKIARTGISLRRLHSFGQMKWVELRDLLALDGRRCVVNGRRMRLPSLITFVENAHLTPSECRRIRELCLRYHEEVSKTLVCAGVRMSFDDVLISVE